MSSTARIRLRSETPPEWMDRVGVEWDERLAALARHVAERSG